MSLRDGRSGPELVAPEVASPTAAPALPEPRPRAERRRRDLALTPPVRVHLPVLAPPVPPTDPPAWTQFDRVSVVAWANHSLVEWLAGCRGGQTAPDTVLQRARTPEELAREELSASLYRDFLRRAPGWRAERFRDAYLRNVPPMMR